MVDALMAHAAQDRIHTAEERLHAAHERFSDKAVAEAARCFAEALRTGETWWIGFGERCLHMALPEAKARGKQLADAVAAALEIGALKGGSK